MIIKKTSIPHTQGSKFFFGLYKIPVLCLRHCANSFGKARNLSGSSVAVVNTLGCSLLDLRDSSIQACLSKSLISCNNSSLYLLASSFNLRSDSFVSSSLGLGN